MANQKFLPFELEIQENIEEVEKILKIIREKNISLNFSIDSEKTASELINKERER